MKVDEAVNERVPIHAKTTTTILPKRGERGTGSTITIDLTEYPELLDKIRKAAKSDDREPSKWLRRMIVNFDNGGMLFGDAPRKPPTPDSGILTEE